MQKYLSEKYSLYDMKYGSNCFTGEQISLELLITVGEANKLIKKVTGVRRYKLNFDDFVKTIEYGLTRSN